MSEEVGTGWVIRVYKWLGNEDAACKQHPTGEALPFCIREYSRSPEGASAVAAGVGEINLPGLPSLPFS
ncbi:hypothetical protein HK414_08705 [Ramlibacter terrae]|uniref:DUF3304 domain-containing protein n=1 Tax=Ramlibacter terrae TaxID=2732511 RepID=A0ABX6P1I4_9BURK|nr:hypothetical protein HK414_08705 [Ramlibacter terrae]